MADFISRLFAIPSDVSSNESFDEVTSPGNGLTNAGGAAATGGGGRNGGGGHNRTLTPLSLSDGNGTATSASYGEGTLSYGSDSVGTGARSGGEPSSASAMSADTTEEDLLHLGPTDRRYRHGEVIEGGEQQRQQQQRRRESSGGGRGGEREGRRRKGDAADRGRQRRSDASVHRSASEPRRDGKKTHRSHSMASSGAAYYGNLAAAGGGGGRNMQLDLNSPKKKGNRRHRSLSKMGARAAGSSSSNRDPTLARAESWSSGEGEEEGRRRHPHSSSRASSSARRKAARDTPPTPGTAKSTQKTPEVDNDVVNSSNRSRQTAKDRGAAAKEAAPKKGKKKDKRDGGGGGGGWRSKFAGNMKKHLSPGTGTPDSKKGGCKGHSKKKRQKDKNDAEEATPPPTKSNKKGHGQNPQPSPATPRTPQPINVGDSIFISQQFLEEGMEMSVLTMPRELAVMNHDQKVAAEFAETIQEVGQRCTMENDHVQRFLARHRRVNERKEHALDVVPSSSTGVSTENGRGPMYPKISEYANRVLEEGHIYQSYSQDREDDGAHHVEVLSPRERLWPCDPPADGRSPTSPDSIPPPPPPPPPPPLSLPPLHRRSPRSRDAAAVPHFNTPVNSNSESISTSYDDPPGTLVESPTLLTLQYSRSAEPIPESGPPGERSTSLRPFDEGSGVCVADDDGENDGKHRHAATPPGKAPTPNGQHKRGSNKAVTFSLPPPSSSPNLPAPPFMGPPLDYYYSMERSPGNDPLPWMSSSPLLPPIIELWSSIDSACDASGDVGGGVAVWNAKRENELLGEELPLHVSEKWIGIHDKKKVEQENRPSDDDAGTAAHVGASEEMSNGDTYHQQIGFKQLNSTTSSSTWEANKHYSMDDTPHDEYFDDVIKKSHDHDEFFDDILNCREEFGAMHAEDHNAHDDNRAAQQQMRHNTANLITIQSNSSDDANDDGINKEDARLRHRSTWNTAYKPPKLSDGGEDDWPNFLPDPTSSGGDKWQGLVRRRAESAMSIQKSVRGMLDRQQLRLLMDAVSVIQPCIRRFLQRKRYLEYLKVKRSYYPRRWERSNMSVAI